MTLKIPFQIVLSCGEDSCDLNRHFIGEYFTLVNQMTIDPSVPNLPQTFELVYVFGRQHMYFDHLQENIKFSRKHFQIILNCSEDGKFSLFIEDCGSRNGTFVDGDRLSENNRLLLEHGKSYSIEAVDVDFSLVVGMKEELS